MAHGYTIAILTRLVFCVVLRLGGPQDSPGDASFEQSTALLFCYSDLANKPFENVSLLSAQIRHLSYALNRRLFTIAATQSSMRRAYLDGRTPKVPIAPFKKQRHLVALNL